MLHNLPGPEWTVTSKFRVAELDHAVAAVAKGPLPAEALAMLPG